MISVPTTPVLFLDIDGVLVSTRSMIADGKRLEATGSREVAVINGAKFHATFDQGCVSNLNRLFDSVQVDVVLSSCWRVLYSLEDMQSYLTHQGVKCRLIGATPRSWASRSRGREIEKWRHDNHDDRPFIILDDSSDMDPYMDRLVRTSFDVGLQASDVDQALELLGG